VKHYRQLSLHDTAIFWAERLLAEDLRSEAARGLLASCLLDAGRLRGAAVVLAPTRSLPNRYQ
jgi:hypothetical protein